MAVIDYEKKEVNAKIVYYGPGLSGKTSNIHYIYSKLMPEHRGELMTLSTKSHRTLFFDFLPVELGEVKGLNTRFYLYTVPGQIFYNNIRKQILKDVDGIVFVADSRIRMKNENLQSFQNLEENLAELGKSLREVPHIIQYNKRDMPELQTLEDLHRQINKYNAPAFESTALNGNGVLKTLTTISKLVLKRLREASSIQTKTTVEGPAEAYGLSDDFIAMTIDEARQFREKTGDQTIPPGSAPGAPQPAPAPPGPPPAPARPAAPPPATPPATPARPAAPAPPPPPQVQAPIPAAPPPAPPAPAVPAPTPAPTPAPANPAPPPPPPAPASAGAKSGAPTKLVVARWGNPQVTSGGIIKLPLTFKDPATGQEYTTLVAIQINPLTPSK
jgi:mutual gliding-motility protein MglA